MFLVPYRQSTLTATVDAAEFAARLAALTSPTQSWFRSLVGRYEFVGNVSPEGFELTPVFRGRNTYRPRVTGVVRGSEIRITQSVQPLGIAAIFLVLGIPILVSLFAGDGASALGLLGMLAGFHVILYFAGFLPEVRRVETRLQQLAAP
jgi:hypothetical protein